MVILVRLVGVAIAVLGVVFFLNPKTLRQYMEFWSKGRNVYKGGVINIVVAVIFLLAASQCTMPLVISVLGIWSLVKGIVIIVRGPEKVKSMIDWWIKKPPKILRLVSVLAVAVGALLIYAA